MERYASRRTGRRSLTLPRALRWAARAALGVAAIALGSSAQLGFAQNTGPCGSNGSLDSGLEVVGLTVDQRLVCFVDRDTSNLRVIGRVTGLSGGERLVAIDYRPSDGRLYGLGEAGGIYRINDQTGESQLMTSLRAERGNEQIQLMGTAYGIDFNPITDRMRIVSDVGQSMRVNPDDGATILDSRVNVPDDATFTGTGISAIAYTNNDEDDSTSTLLYVLDTRSDAVLIQAPENSGVLNKIRDIGADIQTTAAFDIFSLVQGEGEERTTVGLIGLAAVVSGGQSLLVDVDIATGLLGVAGDFDPTNAIIGLAIPLVQSAIVEMPADDMGMGADMGMGGDMGMDGDVGGAPDPDPGAPGGPPAPPADDEDEDDDFFFVPGG